jgi:hypothetical protein
MKKKKKVHILFIQAVCDQIPAISSFFLFGMSMWDSGFELRASHLQGSHSTTWATPAVHFTLVIFELWLFVSAGLELQFFQSQPPKQWDYSYEPLVPGFACLWLIVITHYLYFCKFWVQALSQVSCPRRKPVKVFQLPLVEGVENVSWRRVHVCTWLHTTTPAWCGNRVAEEVLALREDMEVSVSFNV